MNLDHQQKFASLVHRQAIEIQQKVGELSIVRRVSEELIRAVSLEDACQRLINIILSEIHVENCSIMLLEDGVLKVKAARGQLEAEFTSGSGESSFRIGEGIAGQAALTQESIIIHDTRKDSRFTIREGQKTFVGSLLCIPLIDQQNTMGVLNLSAPETNAFKIEHERILKIIAGQAAVILTKLQLEEALKKAHDALRISEEQFRLMADTSRDLICITDDKQNIIFVNEVCEKLLGFAVDELKGKPLQGIIGEIFRDDFKRVLNELSQNHVVLPRNLGLLRKDEKSLEVEGSFTQFRMSDGKIHFVFDFRDLTERMQLLAEIIRSQKMEATATMAGGIAHDFNNLIGIIIPYSDMIKRSSDLSRIMKYVEHINEAAHRAARLTRELLNFVRPEKVIIETLDLNKIVKNTADLLTAAITKNVTVALELSGAELLIKGESSQIGQAIMNLGLNARDAIPENQNGRIFIRTGTMILSPDEAYLLQVSAGEYSFIEMRDSGVGIPADILPKIFEPFFTTKAKDKGTGLGLSMVYSVVKSHGGTVKAQSVVGKGSIFSLFFPVAKDFAKTHYPEPENVASGNHEAILVVDDVEGVRKMLEDVLSWHGYQVIEASGGIPALKIFEEKHLAIDVVLLDMVMPDLNGKETFLRLKNINSNVPVILTSGFIEHGKDVQELFPIGLAGFLKKPYDNRELLILIRKVIDQNKKKNEH